jgi:hypothetical protein
VIIGDAQDRLAVEARDGSRAEIPFVEALVLKVDIANDEIIVDLPEGLFEPRSGIRSPKSEVRSEPERSEDCE